MATFAVIENGLVSNVIVADTLEIAQSVVGGLCVEYTTETPAGIGWLYNGKTFTDPNAVEAPTTPVK